MPTTDFEKGNIEENKLKHGSEQYPILMEFS